MPQNTRIFISIALIGTILIFVLFKNELKESYAKLQFAVKVLELSFEPVDEFILMPVQGVRLRSVADTWGAPRDADRKHEGQDIFAKKGTPIFSATEGYIIRITDKTIGGNSIFVVGRGGRWYYYTHLDAYAPGLSVGMWVTPQTVLGYVGTTGNATTTPPHLHFGVYTLMGAIDPLPLLRDRPPTSEIIPLNTQKSP